MSALFPYLALLFVVPLLLAWLFLCLGFYALCRALDTLRSDRE